LEVTVDAPKSNAPARTTNDPTPRLPDSELIRLDAAAHPERTYAEHVQAAREIAGRTYREDLRRIYRPASTTLARDLEADVDL
jgi:hypothetical protein